MKNYTSEFLSYFNGKKIIIAGCNGYIGRELSNQLEINNIEYIGIDKTLKKNNSSLHFNLMDSKIIQDLVSKEKPDYLIGTSGRLMTAILTWFTSSLIRKPYAIDLRDIFSETISDLFSKKNIFTGKVLYKLFSYFDRRVLLNANCVNVVSKGFPKYFEEKGIKSKSNWHLIDHDVLATMRESKRILKVPAGSLVIWDSRSFHQNQYGEPESEKRMVQYVCYFPKNHKNNTPAIQKKRRKYFEERRTTSHWPAPIKVNGKQGRTFGDNSKIKR